MKNERLFFLISAILCLSLAPFALAEDNVLPTEAEIQAAKNSFVTELLQDFTPFEVIDVAYDPRLALDYSVIRKGATGKGFDYISPEFDLITEKTLADGLKYRFKNWSYFKRTYRTYGVESYYILGILRLESYFGENKPRRAVPASLYSIYVLDAARRNFAMQELKSFLLMVRESGADPFSIKGSGVGAFGIPQFIPTSFHKFAVDGNGDRKIDLFDHADAIVSVANYLKRNGWGKTPTEKRKAIYAYNHDTGYVNAVMAYAGVIEAEVVGILGK